jgi:hypothetical protein
MPGIDLLAFDLGYPSSSLRGIGLHLLQLLCLLLVQAIARKADHRHRLHWDIHLRPHIQRGQLVSHL